MRSIAVFEGQVEELSGAVVRQQVHALLDDGDVGEEVAACVAAGVQVVDGARIAEWADEPADIIAREFAQPRDGVVREQAAQESVEELDHGWEDTLARGAVRFARVYPPIFRANALRLFGSLFLRPAVLISLYPPNPYPSPLVPA